MASEVPDASSDAAMTGANGCKDTPAASSESNRSPSAKFFHSGHFALSRSRAKLLAVGAGMMFILLCAVRAELGSGISRLLKRLRRPVS